MNSMLKKLCPALVIAVTPTLLLAQNTQKLSYEQMEQFLKTAKIVKIKNLSTGITNSRRATLDDGTMQHDAHVQSIDEHKAKFEGERSTEINFVDSWKYNVAAYRLGRVLELDMIPVSVERNVAGTSCAVTWWIDSTMMETERKKKGMTSPDPDKWNEEMYMVRVFDQLIYNTDRNLQNLLIDQDWHIWMIDHTRGFRTQTSLMSKKDLVRCDRKLLAKLRGLDAQSLEPLKPYVGNTEIKGLLGRRDKIVAFFDDEVKSKGEAAILYDRPAR
jgi:hypothetical protein